MTDEEYREFLIFLFERYVRARLPRIRAHFGHHMMDEWRYHLDQATRAAQILRFIESYCDDNNDDAYRTFNVERLARSVSDTRNSLAFSNRTTEEAGFLDAFEDHTREILGNLQASHLPEADREVLREMGSSNPEVELRTLVYQARASGDRVEQSAREIPIRKQLQYVAEELKKDEVAFEEMEKESKGEHLGEIPKKPRRWFKGLGQIAQGSALSIANVALAVGALHFPVSPETQTWGAVASVSTGIGTVLNGVGDLRNE
ncbi:MAG: hypothetical protein WAN65_24565 [Candidatus Sulfotelmatobacter sp.]